MSKVFIVMGVTCSGKSTIGNLLAASRGCSFYDGDDFHPTENVAKMSQGIPLNDTDRVPWLESLAQLAKDNLESGGVIACSALKSAYRNILSVSEDVIFVYLEASKELIKERIKARKEHFMPEALVDSQFDALEVPKDCLTISVTNSPSDIVQFINNNYPNAT
ncbi:MAG: gluconokinase [Cyclobacteriaceae bacterium]